MSDRVVDEYGIKNQISQQEQDLLHYEVGHKCSKNIMVYYGRTQPWFIKSCSSMVPCKDCDKFYNFMNMPIKGFNFLN